MKIITTIIAILAASLCNAQVTTVETIDAYSNLRIAVPKFTTEVYSGDVIRVETMIVSDREDVVRALSRSGRYSVAVYHDSGQPVMTMPKLNKSITIDGEELLEDISVKVYIPRLMNHNGYIIVASANTEFDQKH